MEFQKVIDRAMQVHQLIEAKEKQLYGSPWTSQEIALGFVGDVGDLAKLISAENGRRIIPDSRQKLEHELADCLWSLIVLSNLHGVDLEKSFSIPWTSWKGISWRLNDCQSLQKE